MECLVNKLRTTHLCKGSDKIEVIDIGLKSLGLAGLEILGIITAAFHCHGTTPSATDCLNISPDAETMQVSRWSKFVQNAENFYFGDPATLVLNKRFSLSWLVVDVC